MIAALLVAAAGSLARPELTPLHERQQLVAITMAAAILLLVLELVRRRKLREEYSWVWIVVALLLLALATVDGMVMEISSWIGSATSTSTLFFGGLVFLMLLALQFSVRLSRLTHRYRALSQRTTLIAQELADLRTDLGRTLELDRKAAEHRSGGDMPLHTPPEPASRDDDHRDRRQPEGSA